MSTPTPETDAAEVTAGVVGDVTAVGEKWVNSKVARKLERERDEWRNNYQTALNEWEKSMLDRDAWKAKSESLIKACRDQAWTHDIGQSRGTYCACRVCQIIKEYDACSGRTVKEEEK